MAASSGLSEARLGGGVGFISMLMDARSTKVTGDCDDSGCALYLRSRHNGHAFFRKGRTAERINRRFVVVDRVKLRFVLGEDDRTGRRGRRSAVGATDKTAACPVCWEMP